MWTKDLSACALQDVIILVSYGVCRFCRRSLLGGVVQIEAIQELCKLLVVVSSEIQNNFLGMMLVIFALGNEKQSFLGVSSRRNLYHFKVGSKLARTESASFGSLYIALENSISLSGMNC